MKNFIYLITFALLVTSCSSILDEDAHSVAAETFYNTPEEAAAAALPASRRRPLHCRAHSSPVHKSSIAAARKFVSSSSSR